MSALAIDHPTGLVFMDETNDDLFFGVGCLKVPDPRGVLNEFVRLRHQFGFDKKLRWADIGSYSEQFVEFARQAALLVARHDHAHFACALLDLKRAGGIAGYGSIPDAYTRLGELASVALVEEPDELVSVLMDQFDAPAGTNIEGDLKDGVNRRLQRLGVVTAQRVGSASTDGLQLADLMLGAIAHEFRASRRNGSDESKRDLSLALLTDGYGLTAYHNAHGGRTLPGRLTVILLPAQTKRRGSRGGRRPRPPAPGDE